MQMKKQKNALLSQSRINEIIQISEIKRSTRRKKEVQTSLLNLVQFCGLHNIYKLKGIQHRYDTAPAVLLFLSPLRFSNPRN